MNSNEKRDSSADLLFPKIRKLADIKLLWALFILSITLLTQYLYFLRFYKIDNGLIIFWALSFIMLLSVFIQIISQKYNKYWHIIIFEILIINLVLHCVFQLPFEFVYGSDAYYDMGSLKSILETSKIPFTGYDYSTTLWPMLHIFGASVLLCTGLDVNSTVKLIPFLIELIVPILLFLLFRTLTQKYNEQIPICLMSTLLYVFIFNHIQFGSLFIRQTIAIPLIIIIIYCGFRQITDHNIPLIGISILLIATLAMSHHFSSFVFLIILGILLISGIIFTSSRKISNYIFIFGGLIILSYWAYITSSVLTTIVDFVQHLFVPARTYLDIASSTGSSYHSLRDYIIYIGFAIFNVIFGSLIIAKRQYLKDLYGFICIFFWFGLVGVVLFFLPLNIYPDRLLGYGWLFGALPLICSIYVIKTMNFKKIALGIVLIFLIYNIYVIPPLYYTNPSQNLAQPTFEDYSTTYKIDMSEGMISAYQNNEFVIIDIYKIRPLPLRYTLNKGYYNNSKQTESSLKYIAINNKFYDKISSDKDNYLKYVEYMNYISKLDKQSVYKKILDSNNVRIFQIN